MHLCICATDSKECSFQLVRREKNIDSANGVNTKASSDEYHEDLDDR